MVEKPTSIAKIVWGNCANSTNVKSCEENKRIEGRATTMVSPWQPLRPDLVAASTPTLCYFSRYFLLIHLDSGTCHGLSVLGHFRPL